MADTGESPLLAHEENPLSTMNILLPAASSSERQSQKQFEGHTLCQSSDFSIDNNFRSMRVCPEPYWLIRSKKHPLLSLLPVFLSVCNHCGLQSTMEEGNRKISCKPWLMQLLRQKKKKVTMVSREYSAGL